MISNLEFDQIILLNKWGLLSSRIVMTVLTVGKLVDLVSESTQKKIAQTHTDSVNY